MTRPVGTINVFAGDSGDVNLSDLDTNFTNLKDAVNTYDTVDTFTASGSLTVADAGLVLADASGGAITLTLPAANTLAAVKFLVMRKDSTTNTISVQCAGSDTFNDGSTSKSVSSSLGWMSDGSSTWYSLQMDTASGSTEISVGDIIFHGSSTVRSGFLVCDFSAVSRTTYSALYGEIGTSWGAGDGSTTFNLPRLQGRVPIGAGQGSGLSNYVLGTVGGEETHTMTLAELVAHTHSYQNFGSNRQNQSGGTGPGAGYIENVTTGSEGSGSAFNVMQPYAVGNWLIKY